MVCENAEGGSTADPGRAAAGTVASIRSRRFGILFAGHVDPGPEGFDCTPATMLASYD